MKDIFDLLGRIFISFIFFFEAYDALFFFKDTKINYRIFFSEDKDPTRAPRLLGNDEEVVPRFTLGLQSRPRRHLVPLPWQLDQYTNKDISNSVPFS